MCGIAGIIDREQARPDDLAAMVASIYHRGPDEEGHVTLPFAALGMRRLAIVDLSGGRQPFTNEDQSIYVVTNGEIYNFEAVKRDLQALGHAFHSRSDIEVIAHAYEEYGVGFLARLQGMFAIALWDSRTRTLIAARDRAGEKPLYYAQTPGGLVLGSEIKALLASGRIERRLNHAALDQFLTYEYVITPQTIFDGIQRLPAAHYLRLQDGQLSVHRYWDAADVAVKDWRDADAIEAFRTTFASAVDAQMMSDVPLGVFLSGGIDSSAIVAFMADAARRRKTTVNSFSMGFDDGSYNELPFAREIATVFGTNHREGRVTPDVAGLFDRLVLHFDEPFGDVSLFPTFQVSELARQHVTVALAGDGGDELFGGYDAYDAEALAARWQHMAPQALWRALDAVASRMPPADQKKGLINKVKRFAEGVARAPHDIAQYRWMTFAHPAEKARLYTAGLPRPPRRHRCACARARGAGTVPGRRLPQPAAVCGPVDLPRRRHPREGRPDEHGHVARDSRTVPRRRRHGAGLLDARAHEDPERRAQVGAQACARGTGALGHPEPEEGRVQHPDEAVAQARVAPDADVTVVAGADGAAWPVRAGDGAYDARRAHGRQSQPRPRAVLPDGLRTLGRRPPDVIQLPGVAPSVRPMRARAAGHLLPRSGPASLWTLYAHARVRKRPTSCRPGRGMIRFNGQV